MMTCDCPRLALVGNLKGLAVFQSTFFAGSNIYIEKHYAVNWVGLTTYLLDITKQAIDINGTAELLVITRFFHKEPSLRPSC